MKRIVTVKFTAEDAKVIGDVLNMGFVTLGDTADNGDTSDDEMTTANDAIEKFYAACRVAEIEF